MSHPLTALFVDCDSFFASVEQHVDPSLAGRPVGVAPVMAETSCCIAASYEAKAFDVKTGTRISDARIMCPGIAIVESKPAEYVRIHHRIIEAVEDCIHVEAVLSIDEMWAWLPYNWREPAFVLDLGRRIKSDNATTTAPAKTGHGKRGTIAFDMVLKRAFHQARGYITALPAEEGLPPFLIVCDPGQQLDVFQGIVPTPWHR